MVSEESQIKSTTTSNHLWRREGDRIVVVQAPNLGDTLLSMEDLRSMAMELGRHMDTLPYIGEPDDPHGE